MVGCAAARALVILPEAVALRDKQEAKGPGPWFYRLCRAKALCGKRSIPGDLIFCYFFIKEKVMGLRAQER
jgi:hypothetical protein